MAKPCLNYFGRQIYSDLTLWSRRGVKGACESSVRLHGETVNILQIQHFERLQGARDYRFSLECSFTTGCRFNFKIHPAIVGSTSRTTCAHELNLAIGNREFEPSEIPGRIRGLSKSGYKYLNFGLYFNYVNYEYSELMYKPIGTISHDPLSNESNHRPEILQI